MLANDLNTCTCCVRVCIVCEFSNLNGQYDNNGNSYYFYVCAHYADSLFLAGTQVGEQTTFVVFDFED